MLVALGRDAEDQIEGVVDAVHEADGRDGFETAITGEFTIDADESTLAEEDLLNGELGFGMPAALIVLLIVFGSVVAGLIPVLLSLVSITVALALTALVGQAFPLSVFATNMLTGMGLALGIDYSLFILSRFREERAHGREKLAAIAATGSTASRAVLFSGLAFTLAMVGLLLVPSTVMRSLATGAIAAGLVSVAAALTLLPALLSLLGDRTNALRIPYFGRIAGREQSPFWSRTVRAVTRRPVISLVVSTAILLAMAAPVLGLQTGEAGVSTLPDRLDGKQGYLALNAEFPGETTEPVEIVIDGDAVSPTVRDGNRAPAGAAGERGAPRQPRAGDERRRRSHGRSRSRSRATRMASAAVDTVRTAAERGHSRGLFRPWGRGPRDRRHGGNDRPVGHDERLACRSSLRSCSDSASSC